MKKIISYAVLCLGLTNLALTSCNRDDAPIENTQSQNQTVYTEALSNIANNVIVANYKQLSEKATMAVTATEALKPGDETKLDAARKAWVEMRIYWENSEATLFGPAGDEGLGIDGSIDSWPIDLQFVNNTLKSRDKITVDYVSNLDSNAKGFHALEYLLWGIDGKKKASALTDREIEYIKAATSYIAKQSKTLYNAWNPKGENFAKHFTNPTAGKYKSATTAFEQLVDGMIDIATEVGTGKIENPLNGNKGSYDLEKEESRFSNNSKADFANNIRGILNVYTGDYNNHSGLGLSEIIAAKNPVLDAKVTKNINDAIKGIENIPGTFTESIKSNRAKVTEAQDKVKDLINVLEKELKPFVQEL